VACVTHSLHRLRLIALAFALFFIAGCATPTRAPGSFDINTSQWQGRLALKVASTPPQAFSSNFDLQGSALTGSLTLSTALGSTLARMQWGPGFAMLQTTGEPTQFESLPALVRHVTGTDLPIDQLFTWLQGENTNTPGWDVDFANLAQGRLTARHAGPQGDTELKIILDR
jgi:outer membrane lipoprotein LolB